MDKPLFKLVTLQEAADFINSLAPTVIRKMFYNIDKVAGGVKDGETLVVATHGLVKKTQKTPKSEIKRAQAIRKEYFDNK